MIGFLITTIIMQMIVYCVIFLYKYSEAIDDFNRRNYGEKCKHEFLEFKGRYKWWHFAIPFYWVYTLVMGIVNGIKELEK